ESMDRPDHAPESPALGQSGLRVLCDLCESHFCSGDRRMHNRMEKAYHIFAQRPTQAPPVLRPGAEAYFKPFARPKCPSRMCVHRRPGPRQGDRMPIGRCTPLLILVCTSLANGQQGQGKLAATVHRDAYGVPHVVAATDEAVLFGMAYALAEDDWPLIEENYLRALGRAAERNGEAALREDWLARALEISRLSREEYARSTPRMRRLLNAYAAGLNAFVAAHPDL